MPLMSVTEGLMNFLEKNPEPPESVQTIRREIAERTRSLQFKTLNNMISDEARDKELHEIVDLKLELDRRCAAWFEAHS